MRATSWHPYLALLRTGFTLPRTVARRAVRSYRTISPLPVDRTLPAPSAVCFLWHFPSAHAAQALPGVLPCGARTFLHARAQRRSGRLPSILLRAAGLRRNWGRGMRKWSSARLRWQTGPLPDPAPRKNRPLVGSALWDNSHSADSALWDNSHLADSALWDNSHLADSVLWDNSRLAGSALWDNAHLAGSALWEASPLGDPTCRVAFGHRVRAALGCAPYGHARAFHGRSTAAIHGRRRSVRGTPQSRLQHLCVSLPVGEPLGAEPLHRVAERARLPQN